MRTLILTVLALVAFAANSVLGRLALSSGTIDPASFTTVRMAAGAFVLWVLGRGGHRYRPTGSWHSAFVLFLYAVPFSFAYTGLGTGTGALVLFGAVQVTMLSAALVSGERPHVLQWLGLAAAAAGLVYLVLPGLTAPPLWAAMLMAFAGCCWGLYSLRGRGASNPAAETAGNFARVVPMVAVVSAATLARAHVGHHGLWLAIVSGAVTSGLGYIVWYAALGGLTATRASIVQLAVPVLAALGGVILLDEPITLRLVVAAVLVLGGVAMALTVKGPHR
jgi:drug/metabolite transporter (DMT)-like permease